MPRAGEPSDIVTYGTTCHARGHMTPLSTARRHARRSACLVGAALAPAATARAQGVLEDSLAGPSNRTVACVQALPDSAFHRAAVFVHAEVVDSADARARPAVDLIAQEVSTHVRAALATASATADAAKRLTAVDSAFGRVYPEGRVSVVARRDGRVVWRSTTRRGADRRPIELVERGLAAAHAAGDVLVADEVIRGDSLAFELAFVFARLARPGEPRDTLRVRNPAPVFTALVPQEKQAAARPGKINLRYPASLQAGGFEGRVVLEFVVDTTGHADRGTVRDANPAAAAALAPRLRGPYETFVRSARDAVVGAEFYPAEVGGCRVRQLVRLPLAWTLNR